MTYIAMNSCKNMKQSLKAIINDIYILRLTFDKKTLIKKSILLI